MSSYSEGQVHQLMNRFEAEGFTALHLTQLGQFWKLTELLDVLEGRAEIILYRDIIDCDVDPFIPDGWKVEEHKKSGRIRWGSQKVKLHTAASQLCLANPSGDNLREYLSGRTLYNANVLDFLFKKENQHFIPEEWKRKSVFFWGTIYNAGGHLCVRCLRWRENQWEWQLRWLTDLWGSEEPAATSR